ncbi:MAG: type 1 periplasmic binding fold superfamily protein [Chlorobiales bacterium]
MQKKNVNSLILFGAIVASVFAFGCSDDPAKPNPPANESETITTVQLRLVQTDDATRVFQAQWRDLDGEGSNPPVITGFSNLPANKTFSGSVKVLNETKSPPEDLTEEIEEEDEAHQFFYIVSGATLTFEYADADSSGKPVGLKTTVTTGAASSGTLRVILKHEATKNNTIGEPSTDGETDIDITLPATVQ